MHLDQCYSIHRVTNQQSHSLFFVFLAHEATAEAPGRLHVTDIGTTYTLSAATAQEVTASLTLAADATERIESH